ncbi:MAG: TonB-dependent receptor [Proteobacteria bacterium]|nr:TonB-dependent receptor [Pseudomonadota bacterium]
MKVETSTASALFLCLFVATTPLAAKEEMVDSGISDDAPKDDIQDSLEGDDIVYETVVVSDRPPIPRLPKNRAGSEVKREDIQRRNSRSAPDALRYEPGVFVQQTAHSQGSAFVRGLTGQQTLLMFDGIRLNNSTYRQGPNQYFFNLDSQTIQSIQVVRGGASTRYGSDALGGVVMAVPIEAQLADPELEKPITWDPHLIFRGATSDDELGGRAQTNVTLGKSFAIFGGAGGRRVGQLESGGIVYNPRDGDIPKVPHFEDDNRTQLGTGFEEFTADGRLVYKVDSSHYLTLAAYTYRQFDAPRTDQCPAAYAPYDECLQYDNQNRTLIYAAWEGEPRLGPLKNFRITLSWQNQLERRTLSRPSAHVENIGKDRVDTLGASISARTIKAEPAPWLELELNYGADTYYDFLESNAWISFADIAVTQKLNRGQYIDNSRYLYGGLFAEGKAGFFDWLYLRAGGRVSWINAEAPAVSVTGSESLSKSWFPFVWNTGVEAHVVKWLHFLVNIDRSFRAPNLDDMTSRQQTGPGFQFENPDLGPENATTYEAGTRLVGPVMAELWIYQTLLGSTVVKSPREADDCPPDTAQCENSWTRFQLVNSDGQSKVRGIEAVLFSSLPGGFETRFTLSWTWGEGPNMGDPPSDPDLPYDDRVPLSRIPPLNGTAEILWRHPIGFSTGASLRWAALQKRLALSDISDERIPKGGTPGFAVLDLSVSYRLMDKLFMSIVFENVFDTAYRYHGSSVNGPGRGAVLLLDVGPLWRL